MGIKLKPSQVRVGMVFNRLTVTRIYREEKSCPSSRTGFRSWRVADAVCVCGRNKAGVRIGHLVSGATESCGSCGLQQERTREVVTTHGLRNDPLYIIIWNMNERCKNPDHPQWKNYGGDDITIEYPPWDRDINPDGYVQSFVEWNAQRAPQDRWRSGLEIDRIENNRGYHPNNCRWATSSRQKRNTRITIMRQFRGKEMPLADIYDVLKAEGKILDGISYRCFKERIRLGWTLWKASKTPVRDRTTRRI